MSDIPQDEDDGITLSAEVMDRAERKRLREQQKAEENANKLPQSEEEIERSLANSKLAKAKLEKRRKIFKLSLAGVGVLFLGWFIHYLFTPYKGEMTFGICKTYLELNVQFPQELRLSTVSDFGQYVRIWYTQLDAFGEYRMESIQCHFRADEVTGAAVEKILINRRPVDQQKIEEFNKIIPVILSNPPDLTIPYPLPDSLENLQINTNLFRKPIF